MKYFFWDWNGTLIDDTEYSVEVINFILEKYNLPQIDLAYYRKIFTFPVVEYYKRLGFDFEKYSFAEVGKEFIDLYNANLKKCTLHKGAVSVIHYLKDRGYKQVLISAREENSLRQDVAYYGLNDLLDGFYGIDNIYASGKDYVYERFFSSNRVLDGFLVGDTIHDCEIAGKFGLKFIYFSGGHQDFSHFKDCKVYARIDSLLKLMNLL